MSSKSDYQAFLLEEIRDQNRAVLEVVGQMQQVLPALATKAGLASLDRKVTTIGLALKDTNKDLRNLTARTTKIELAVFKS